ncbi:MAG: hypothetical protein AAGF31_02680 [Planctomycetota bacterium]
MPRFHYEAIDAQGQPVTGEVDAVGFADAAEQLERQGLVIQAITQPTSDERAGAASLVEPASTELTAAVERVMASRETVTPPLTAYVQELSPGRHRRQLRALLSVLEQGDVAQAVAAAQDNLPTWAPLLAAAAEETPPEDVFHRFLESDQPTPVLRRRRLLVLAYPLVVLTLLLLIALPIAWIILPEFRDIYCDFGLDLPVMTEFVLAFSDFVTGIGGVLLVVVAVALIATYYVLSEWQPAWLTRLVRRVGLGVRSGPADAAQQSLASAQLLQAGLPIEQIRTFEPLTTAGDRHLEMRPEMRPAFAYALGDQIAPAQRVSLLRALSDCYVDQSERRASWVRGVFGPVAIVLLGIMVAFVVVALFLPMVTLVEALT